MPEQTKASGPSAAHVLDRIFRAQSVAIVGASAQPGPRNRIVQAVIRHGYAGKIYPITRSHAEVEGLAAYRTIADLPEIPDVALIITPAATVPAIIDECGAKGIKAAIVFSSGFEEVEGGRELADQLRDAARRHDIAVLGANGQGVWSVAAKTMLTFGSAAFTIDSLKHAPIAIISQSGALAGAIGAYLQKTGLGCSYIVSVGNETCLDALDVLDWIIRQDDVRVVVLYLEGLHDAGRLLALAARARARGIQVVALKTGRSAFGQAATASHTGKIASPYAIYLDVLEQAGVVVVESLAEAMAAAEVFSFMPGPRVSADSLGGVAILSSSGGAGALLADHGEEAGLPMATFGSATVERLQEILPAFARKENPVDLTGQVRGIPNLFRDSLATIAADPRIEAVVIQFASSGMRDLAENGDVFKAAARDTGFPIIVTFAAEIVPPEIRTDYREAGILVSSDPFDTMRALRWLYARRRYAAIELGGPSELEKLAPPRDWASTMDWLADAGVPPAAWHILPSSENAAEACTELAYPLVVKALPSEAEHKTEMGLVKLRVASPGEVDAHAADFRRVVGKPDMAVLVQEMIGDGVEVVLSCLRATDFGPILSIGSGGTAVELYRDITYLALPTTPAQVRTALSKLKLWTQLQGFRGAPPADVDVLVDAAVRFGDHFLATPELAEMEVNPVMVRPVGKGIAAVDSLATFVSPG